MKRRVALLVTVAAVALGAPAQANAAPISTDYCTHSLRGGGTLAPDNDIKREWDAMESYYRWDITNSWAESWTRYSDDNLAVEWVFYGGGYVARARFQCWRDGTGYHDGVMWWTHAPR